MRLFTSAAIVTLLIAAGTASVFAQTSEVDQRWEKARLEVNTAENALGRALYALDKLKEALDAAPTPTPAPSPTATPSPLQPVTDPATGIESLPELADGLDAAPLLRDTAIAASGEPDVVGAFRFLCAPSHLAYDDPVIMPGRPGEFHLHQFFGNTGTDAFSTYSSLRETGDSTCVNELNRSAYWQPAMIQTLDDGSEQVVVPDFHNIYYKRRPADDPEIEGIPADLPNGMRMVFGWQPGDAKSRAKFKCISKDGNSNVSPDWRRDMAEALADCAANGGGKLDVTVSSWPCWNGKLDSSDHRSHTTWVRRNADTDWERRCPDSHPYILPVYTNQSIYTVLPSDRPATWRLASDSMAPDQPAGYTFHTDVMWAWNDEVLARWMANCIDKLLTCTDANLGDGQILRFSAFYKETRAAAADGGLRLPVPARQHEGMSH